MGSQREQCLIQELEVALAGQIEWRSIAHKLKEDISQWSEECDRLKRLVEAGKSTEKPSAGSSGTSHDVFRKVRALLSKGLHPDLTKDPLEKSVRTKLFQQLWEQINDLESHA